jgi:hypothetical protein
MSSIGILASVTRQQYGGAAGGTACKLFLTDGKKADLHAEPIAEFSQECALQLRWVKPTLLVVSYHGNMTEVWRFKNWMWFGGSAETQFRVEIVLQRESAE